MAENEAVPFSDFVTREAKQLLESLKKPDIEIIRYNGWYGVGRWRIVEYATKLANEINLFDIIISINLQSNESSRGKLQLRIAESLGIPSRMMDEETDIDVFISVQIYEKLKDKRFLLILGGLESSLYQNIDMIAIGVPNLRRRFASGSIVISKVILVGERYELRNFNEKNVEDLRVNIFVSNVIELIREEVALAAHSARTKGYFSPDTVMHFMYYFSLAIPTNLFETYNRRSYSSENLPGPELEMWYAQRAGPFRVPKFGANIMPHYSFVEDKEWMIRYWIAEELIAERMEKDKEDLMEIMDALLTELYYHSIIAWDGKSVKMIPDVHKSLMKDVTVGKARFDLISFISEDGLPEEDDESCGWEVYQRMSAIITPEKINVNIPPSPKCPNLSTLILRFHTDRGHEYRFEFPITFFEHMKNLRVLDLHQAPIESLPSSLSSLCNLKLLTLQECEKLVSLPTSFRDLIRLEFLNLSGCRNLKVIPEECFELMDRLRVLDLSKTQIDSLPSSVFKLYNLQQLLLSSCRALKTGVSPQSLQNLTSLEELDLSWCEELQDIRDVSFHDTLPKLRRLNISCTSTPHRLSFRGCETLETLELINLSKLEVLYVLYSTKFKTLHLDSFHHSLRRLDILPTRYSNVQFEGINWRDDDVGARIWVEDLKSNLEFSGSVFEAPCFSRFYIRISPFEEEGCMPMTIDEFQNIHLKRKPVVYESIYDSHTKTFLFSHFASRSAFDRILEICRSDSSQKAHYTQLHGIYRSLLALTESITFLFNTSDIGTLCPPSWLYDLKEYRIGGCPKISSLFAEYDGAIWIPDLLEPTARGDLDILPVLLPVLEVIWVSDLPQLSTICKACGEKGFALLKHIYIEHCPKLEALFTSSMYLQSLETLEIKFCCRLQKVFETEAVGGGGLLQNLRSLYLLHVPKLKSVCNGFIPRLEKVQVHRCPLLRKLPIQVCLIDRDINGSGYAASSSLPVVVIRGESKWWKDLQWDNKDDRNKRPVRFRPWRCTPSTLLSHGIEW